MNYLVFHISALNQKPLVNLSVHTNISWTLKNVLPSNWDHWYKFFIQFRACDWFIYFAENSMLFSFLNIFQPLTTIWTYWWFFIFVSLSKCLFKYHCDLNCFKHKLHVMFFFPFFNKHFFWCLRRFSFLSNFYKHFKQLKSFFLSE